MQDESDWVMGSMDLEVKEPHKKSGGTYSEYAHRVSVDIINPASPSTVRSPRLAELVAEDDLDSARLKQENSIGFPIENIPHYVSKAQLHVRSDVSPSKDPFCRRTFRSLGEGSLRGSIFTLTSSSLGGGVLTLPYAISQSGLIWGPIVFIIAGWSTWLLMRTIVRCAHLTGSYTYPQCAEKMFGRPGKIIVLLMIGCYLLGTLISFLVVVGNLLPDAIKSVNPDAKFGRLPCICVCFGLACSISYFRRMTSLRHISIIGPFTLVYASIVLIIEMPYFVHTNDYSKLELAKFDIHLFQNVSIMLFSYICHSNIFRVQGELVDSGMRRMNKVINWSLSILTGFYAIIGCIGYLSFLDHTPKLFTNREKPAQIHYDILMFIAKILITGICTLKIPLNLSPCRDAILTIFNKTADTASTPLFVGLTTVILGVTLVLAILLPNIIAVISVLGGSLGVAHAFIFPAIMEFKLSYDFGQLWRFSNLLLLLVTIMITICGFGSVITTLAIH